MATKENPTPTPSSAAVVLKAMQKEYGASVVVNGSEDYLDTTRIPTSVFPFDLMSGGGFPLGRVSVVYGPEASGKTNLVLKAIGAGQRKFPNKLAVFVDAEYSFDPVWASQLGVDLDRLLVVHPDYAEQAVDIIQSFLYADDVFVIVLDSLAALSTQNEINSGAEKVIVGGASLLVGKMFKKIQVSFSQMRNQGLLPTAFIGINQIRYKIGVMFGDPETMPGGNAVKFSSSMTVRLYGKAVMDDKVNAVLPLYRDTSVIMKKWKVPILAMKGDYSMNMLPYNGKGPGFVDDWNTVSAYLRELEYLEKHPKAGWIMFNDHYKTLEAARTTLYNDVELLQDAKDQIIADLMAKGLAMPESSKVQDAAPLV